MAQLVALVRKNELRMIVDGTTSRFTRVVRDSPEFSALDDLVHVTLWRMPTSEFACIEARPLAGWMLWARENSRAISKYDAGDVNLLLRAFDVDMVEQHPQSIMF